MIIGVDTGGTKTLVTVFDDDGTLQDKQKFLTPRDIHAYTEQVSQAIIALAPNRSELKAIAIAVPGVVRDQIAIVCKNLGWRNIDIIGLLRANFPEVPMWLENDANLGGVGATRLLASVPRRCLYVTISTGIGGGFIIDGAIEQSLSENEISDIHFEYNGKLTRWGEIANGQAIMDDFGVYASQLGNADDIREIARRLSRGFMALIPVLRPDIITIGGGIGAHYDIFAEHVEKELSVMPEQYNCPIITAPYPEEVVAYGCYFYAKDQLAI